MFAFAFAAISNRRPRRPKTAFASTPANANSKLSCQLISLFELMPKSIFHPGALISNLSESNRGALADPWQHLLVRERAADFSLEFFDLEIKFR